MTQAPEAPARTRARISERTFRTDPWWKTPRIVAAGLTIWVAYATAHVFAGHWYYVAKYHYLSTRFATGSGRAAPSVRLDHARHADADRPVHSPAGQRGLLRSENLQLTERAVV